MPRPPRKIVPGYPYHLSQRGNNKQKLFLSDEDKRIYLYWFDEARHKWGMKILAYCLMDNHVHFVAIADNEQSFSRVINFVHSRYAIYFNKKNGCVGHLWHGRFYSNLLKENHFIAALRYVERNPARANLVDTPWDWVWSSAREHVGMEKGILLLEEIKKFFDPPSWRDFINLPDLQEDLAHIRQGQNRGRPKKKVPGTFF